MDEEKAQTYPPGYRYLAYWQEKTMGVSVVKDLPGHRRHVGTENLEKHDLLYRQAKKWVEEGSLDV